MRYMRWSFDQLMGCPVDYIDVMNDEARRIQAEAEAARRSR